MLKRVREDHRCGREVAEHELVALLGDLRRGRDIDHERDALLLGDLGDGAGLAGVERADQQLCALVDQPLGPRARDIDVRLRVGIHDRELRQTEALEDRRRQLHGALAVLSDECLYAGARQQHADLQRPALGPHNGWHGKQGSRNGGTCQQPAPIYSTMFECRHWGSLSLVLSTKVAEVGCAWNCVEKLKIVLTAVPRPAGSDNEPEA